MHIRLGGVKGPMLCEEGVLGVIPSGAKKAQAVDEVILHCLASDLVNGAGFENRD